MAKSKRTPRPTNKIASNASTDLIPVEPEPSVGGPQLEYRVQTAALKRATMFNAELEAAIEIIARERVYRAMLAGLRRKLLGSQQLRADSGELPRLTSE